MAHNDVLHARATRRASGTSICRAAGPPNNSAAKPRWVARRGDLLVGSGPAIARSCGVASAQFIVMSFGETICHIGRL
nr:hypothetical protein [Mycobacterium pseudoshottsii]